MHTSPSLTELLLQKETLTPGEFPAIEPDNDNEPVLSLKIREVVVRNS